MPAWIYVRCESCYRRRFVCWSACLRFGVPPCRTWGCQQAEEAA